VSAKTRRDADAKLKALRRRIEAGDTPQPGTARETVKTWADQWLPMHEAKVRPNVFVTDRGNVRKWVVPTLGQRRLTDLTPADLRRLTARIVAAGRSTTTAKNVQATLRKMLRDARLEGHNVPERIFDVDLPEAAASDRASIPPDEWARLLATIGRRDDASRWLFAMLYGARQGETLGLTWEAVNLDDQSVSVQWQLREYAKDAKIPARLRTRHLTGTRWLVETKTKRGERWLPLLPFIAASLTAWRELAPANAYGLVWVDADGGPIRPHRDRAEWYAIQAGAGIAHPSGRPWYLHETRHTMVSWLIAEGVDRSIIAAIVGQSALVEQYVHVDRAAMRAALDRFGARFQIEG
jgi:integrase